MKCYLCGNLEHDYVNGQVRDKPEIKILKCKNCGLVFLDTQCHINTDFYEESGMESSNVSSNVMETMDYIDTKKRFKSYYLLFANKRVLDFGCGRGSLLMKLKKEGITHDLYALEPNKQYRIFLKDHFGVYENIDQIPDASLDYITLFHVLEHLSDPLKTLNELHSKLKTNGRIIIEVPGSNDILLNLYNSEPFSKFTYWSCHLYLFNNRTMEDLLQKVSYQIEYIKQYQRYTLANHLYWLAKGKPGGHIIWGFLDDEVLQRHYEKKISELGLCDTIVAMIRKD